jgi:hypothetical protein
MLTAADAVKVGVPPAIRNRYIVRCIGQTFGKSKSSGNPMITLEWEVVGEPQKDGTIAPTIKRGTDTYQVAGLPIRPTYFTLVAGKPLERFFDFQRAAGLPSDSVDETDPDLSGYEGLLMQAILATEESQEMTALTEEEREDGKKPEPILDEDGKPIVRTAIRIASFLKVYNGDVGPAPY